MAETEVAAKGIVENIQLTISGFLGPCDLANVVSVSARRCKREDTHRLGHRKWMNRQKVGAAPTCGIILLPSELFWRGFAPAWL